MGGVFIWVDNFFTEEYRDEYSGQAHFNFLRTYYVYILCCADGTYYTGVTNNVYLRLEQHQLGVHRKAYTFTRRPVQLVYVDATDDIGGAIFREKQIKGWSRKKKEALIRQQEHLLPDLARGRTGYMKRKKWWLQ